MSSKVYISHRGNLAGPSQETENTTASIENAIKAGFDCEVDVWLNHGVYYLGHDGPKDVVPLKFLLDYSEVLWVHCKNIDALYELTLLDLNCFFHNVDDCTLTSKGFLWTYPGKHLTDRSVCVLPEWNYDIRGFSAAFGVCSDYVQKYKEKDNK